jgi:hypothetical protein
MFYAWLSIENSAFTDEGISVMDIRDLGVEPLLRQSILAYSNYTYPPLQKISRKRRLKQSRLVVMNIETIQNHSRSGSAPWQCAKLEGDFC